MTCPHCNAQGVYPEIVLVCTDPKGKNCAGDPYDIYDVQMRMKKVKGANDKQYSLVIESWEVADHDPRLFDPDSHTTDDDARPEMAEKIAESFKKPLPLDQIFAPTSPSEVAQMLNVKNLFAGIPDSVGAEAGNTEAESSGAPEQPTSTGRMTRRPAYRQRSR
jgi:hypothetical protein